MKRTILGLMFVFLFIGANLYAADGDLIVNGNLGVGTTSPAEKLQINSGNIKVGTADKGIVFYGGGEKIIGTSGYGIDFQTSMGTSRMTISNSGNVGIGTSPDSGYRLYVDGGLKANSNGGTQLVLSSTSIGQNVQIAFSKAGSWKWMMGADGASDALTIYDAVLNKHTIYAASNGNFFIFPGGGGNVGIGSWNASYKLQLGSDSAAKPSTSTWTIASDARLKTNIQPYTKGLNELLQVNPVSYKYNGKGGIGHNKVRGKNPITGEEIETETVDTELLSKTHVGVLAQDIQAVVPESVSSHKGKINEDDRDETDLLDFNSHSLTFILINAVKELKAEIDSLNRQIADLKAEAK